MTIKARGCSRPAARAPASPADKRNQGTRQKAKATNRADAAGVVDDCAEELQRLDEA